MSAGDLVSGEIKPDATPKELPLESVMRRHCDSLVVEIRAEDGMQVLRFPERHRALAAYIVRACNAHDDLVKALQEAHAAAHAVLIAGGDYGDDLSDLDLRYLLKTSQATICAALAKAGVK